MNEDIGIDKEKALKLTSKIRYAWNSFFWEFRVCQYHIRFTIEERSNYVGDLLNYFDDTLHHLGKFKQQPDYLLTLYETTAVLQMMFIQQDLLDELLNIFKLDKSSSDEKQFIRQLRNELVGHPISRNKKGELISSVFITGFTQKSTLSYIRYHQSNNYKYDLISCDWKDIFAKHEVYLHQFVDKILIRIGEILSHFSQEILRLKNVAGKISFEKLVPWVNQVFEVYTQNYPLFDPDNLLQWYQKRNTHPRYMHALALFQDGLGERIVEVLREAYRFNQNLQLADIDTFIDFKIKFGSQLHPQEQLIIGEKIDYKFSKLYERDHIFGLDHFKRIYQDDIEITDELQNMSSYGSERSNEFYCSYEYLRHIFQQRGLL